MSDEAGEAENRPSLDSSFLLIEGEERKEPSIEFSACSAPIAERRKEKRKACEMAVCEEDAADDGRYVTVLTPKKERKSAGASRAQSVYLTPVKRTKRAVINGLKTGRMKLFDDSLEVKGEGKYLGLVECFKTIEQLEENSQTGRRESIDVIVKKYLAKKRSS